MSVGTLRGSRNVITSSKTSVRALHGSQNVITLSPFWLEIYPGLLILYKKQGISFNDIDH